MSGQKLWRVDIIIEKSTYLLVLADTRDQAEEDAREIPLYAFEMENEETEYFAREVRDDMAAKLDDQEVIWTGGPDGTDVLVKELRALVRTNE